MWTEHPEVYTSVQLLGAGKSNKNDGSFWISWDDFQTLFYSIDVCVRTKGLSQLRLGVN